MKTSAIILAAGSGSRMKSDIPKQYMEMGGHPVIYYAINAFENSNIDEVILVVRPGDEATVKSDIVQKYGFKKISAIVAGGDERVDSVLCGIEAASGEYVLIHDGARAYVTTELIDRMIKEVQEYPAIIAAVPAKDTIKVVDESGFILDTPDRRTLQIVQTPQAFSKELILSCYDGLRAEKDSGQPVPTITDDAMLVERYSNTAVKVTMGEYGNIKITTPEDLR